MAVRNEKPSVSGLMGMSHEVERFENLFYSTVNSHYYLSTWGLDWEFWLSQDYDLSVDSFLSYLSQEAAKRGIQIQEIKGEVIDFTLEITVTINGIIYNTIRGIE